MGYFTLQMTPLAINFPELGVSLLSLVERFSHKDNSGEIVIGKRKGCKGL